MLTINSSQLSSFAQRQLTQSSTSLSTTQERLSSGLRINSAADDAAGLSISSRMTAQVRGATQAIKNTQDAISLMQTMDGSLDSMTLSLHRLRELAVQGSNDLYTTQDRESLQQEADELLQSINQSAQGSFNGKKLFGTSFDFYFNGAQSRSLSVNSHKISSDTLARQSVASSVNAISTSVDFADGDLTIVNHLGQEVQVRATSITDDDLSTAHQAGSAIAKASAINASSKLHGVTASAQPTRLKGEEITSNQKLGVLDVLTINGVELTGFTVLAHDADNTLLTEINRVSDETGVIATMNAAHELILTAEDGRNIAINATGNAASLGFTDGTVQGAQLTLSSRKGFELKFATSAVNSDAMGLIGHGVQQATEVVNVPQVGGGGGGEPVQLAAGYAVGNPPQFVFDNSYWDPQTKVHSVTGEYQSGGAYGQTQEFYILFYAANRTYLVDFPSSGAPTIDSHIGWVPGQTNQTITFTVNTKSFSINFDAPPSENFPAQSSYLYMKIQLTEGVLDGTFGELQDTGGGGAPAPAPAEPAPTEAVFSPYDQETSLTSINLMSQQGAEESINTIDRALDDILATRAQLGATNNRLEHNSEVLYAQKNAGAQSLSRIQDADVAAEATQLLRSEITQQASVSILAQATLVPELALALLS